jgi:hypothetical protein
MPSSLEKGVEGVIDVGGPTKVVLSQAFFDFFSYSRISVQFPCLVLCKPSIWPYK